MRLLGTPFRCVVKCSFQVLHMLNSGLKEALNMWLYMQKAASTGMWTLVRPSDHELVNHKWWCCYNLGKRCTHTIPILMHQKEKKGKKYVGWLFASKCGLPVEEIEQKEKKDNGFGSSCLPLPTHTSPLLFVSVWVQGALGTARCYYSNELS